MLIACHFRRCLWEIAMCVLLDFRLLIVVGNHSKHLSFSVAYELAVHMGAWLISSLTRRDLPMECFLIFS